MNDPGRAAGDARPINHPLLVGTRLVVKHQVRPIDPARFASALHPDRNRAASGRRNDEDLAGGDFGGNESDEFPAGVQRRFSMGNRLGTTDVRQVGAVWRPKDFANAIRIVCHPSFGAARQRPQDQFAFLPRLIPRLPDKGQARAIRGENKTALVSRRFPRGLRRSSRRGNLEELALARVVESGTVVAPERGRDGARA